MSFSNRYRWSSLFFRLWIGLSVGDAFGASGVMQLMAPGIWFREGNFKGMGHCNNALIEMKDYFIVVDANFPSAVPLILANLEHISPKPVKYVFLTHHHGDHAYGSALWAKVGATVMSFRKAAQAMARYEPARWREAAQEREDVAKLNQQGLDLPAQLLSEPLFVLDDGTRRVEFRYFGPGHTLGDGFVYLPKEGILCAGDAVVNGPFNYTGDAYLQEWLKQLHAASQHKIRYILPGHGESGGREILTGQALFLTELIQAVKTGIGLKRSAEEIADKLRFSRQAEEWIGSRAKLLTQIKDIRREIEQGKPRGELSP